MTAIELVTLCYGITILYNKIPTGMPSKCHEMIAEVLFCAIIHIIRESILTVKHLQLKFS